MNYRPVAYLATCTPAYCFVQGTYAKIVSERLGHSTIGVTMDVYSPLLPGMQREAASKLDHLVTAGDDGPMDLHAQAVAVT